MTDFEMTPSKPYLIRALYEWIVDNGLTPQIAVDANDARARIPREFVKDGQIILNIAARAVGNFSWDNELLAFSARFGGVSRQIEVPMSAVLSIYARENGAGMVFGEITIENNESEADSELEASAQDSTQEENEEPPPPTPTNPPPRPSGRPSLKVIK